MRKVRALLVLGIWVAILPYLGFPNSWKSILFTISGFLVVYASYALYRGFKASEEKQSFENFRENGEFVEERT